MPRPRRNTNPKYFRLVTIRTENAKLFMVPSKELNQIVGGVIAKYQQKYGITLYAYIFLSNHYHLLLRAPKANLWRFEQAVNREIAKRVNRYRNREGHFWARRYDEQIVVKKADVLSALLYIVCNAVKHKLIDSPYKWPGISCIKQLLTQKDEVYYFTDYTAYSKARLKDKNAKLEDFKIKYNLKISPIPELAKLSFKNRIKFLRSEIARELSKYLEQINSFLGKEKILKQSPFSRPRVVSKRKRPICYTKDFLAKLNFIEEVYKPWNESYQIASLKFRKGELDSLFPEFSIKPPLLYLVD